MESGRSYTLATNQRPALAFRDGLLIALLAARPLRLRSITALALGQTLIQHGEHYRILLTPDDNKTRRVLEWTVPDHLSGYLREYLDVHRARLQPDPPVAALWLSEQRRPLSGDAIRGIVRRHARDRLGLNLTPHMFRDVAFTSIALDDPEHVTIGMTLLGHSRIETGERHYNLARIGSAARKHATAISESAGARRTGRLLNPLLRERARQIMLRANRKARRK